MFRCFGLVFVDCFGISCLSLFLGFGVVVDYMLQLVTWLYGGDLVGVVGCGCW